MALMKMPTYTGGGASNLDYDGYSAYIGSTRVSSYTISGDHDFIQLIISGVTANTFVPTCNGVTYNWKGNYSSGQLGAASVLIPNVKDGTSITFSNSGVTSCGIYGLSYT
jgi:hypothetical protein